MINFIKFDREIYCFFSGQLSWICRSDMPGKEKKTFIFSSLNRFN